MPIDPSQHPGWWRFPGYQEPDEGEFGPGYGGFGEGVPGTGPWGWTNPPSAEQPVPETMGPTGGIGGGGGGGLSGSLGGGGGTVQVPELPEWAGAIPRAPWYGMEGALPWQDWANTPWANVPEGRGAEAQSWMNTVLPWWQQQQAWKQFNQQLAWQKNRFGQEQGWTQERFGREMDWARERMQQEQEWQARQRAQQRAMEREIANVQAFGRRWKPNTRWM